MRTNVAIIACAFAATGGVMAAPVAEPIGGGALVKAGTSALTKWGPKLGAKTLPKAVSVASKSGKGFGFLKRFTPEQINKFFLLVNTGFAGWQARDAIDTVSEEFKDVDWEKVAAEGENGGAVGGESPVVPAEAGSGAAPVSQAGVAGGASQVDSSRLPPSKSESSVAGEKDVNPDELTLDELDQIQAGINQQEQNLGDSPDPNLNPFFEDEPVNTF